MDDYMQTMLRKVESIGRLCEVKGVKYALCYGDIFHLKQANRVSDYLRQQLITAFKHFPCEVLVVPGNHDYGPAGLDSLSSQPLGTLERAGAIQILRGDRLTLLAEEGEHDSQVWLAARPYDARADGFYDGVTDPSYYQLTDEERARIEKDPRPIMGLFHGSLIGPGDSRPYPHVNVDKIPNLQWYDLIVSGHIHERLGVVKAATTIFANPGSIGRTRRDMASYARTVGVLMVETGCEENDYGLTVEEVPLPSVAPALEVFGAREVEEGVELQDDEITKFVEMLGEGLPAEKMSLAELMAQDEFADIEAPVKAKVQELLEGAEA